MNRQDLLMALVALIFAAFALTAAVRNRDRDFRFRKLHWIDQRWGRNAARGVYAVLGALLAAMGIAILCGWSLLR